MSRKLPVHSNHVVLLLKKHLPKNSTIKDLNNIDEKLEESENEDNQSSKENNDSEKEEKTQDEIDYQLSRALDLIRGAAVFRDLKS